MLQLTELNRRASAALSFPPASGFNLEGAADGAIAQLREKRSELAQHDWWSRWCVNLDRLIYSDDVEYLDRPDFPVLLVPSTLHLHDDLVRSRRLPALRLRDRARHQACYCCNTMLQPGESYFTKDRR